MSRFEHECIRLVHPERLHPLEAEGPVMLVSAHMGNPELGLQAITFRGRRFTALVENVQPPEMGRFLNRLRSAAGGRFHVASLGGVRAVIEALQAGEVVGMMADRDLQGTGVPVQLAGRRVLLPSGPWEIARRTNATVIPVFAARTWRDRFTMSVEEPFSVPALGDGDVAVQCAAQRFATLMEAHIRRAPGQWAILEDFWQVHRCGKG
jgi:KDO2-lipid IV(A) lauroyltransferase